MADHYVYLLRWKSCASGCCGWHAAVGPLTAEQVYTVMPVLRDYVAQSGYRGDVRQELLKPSQLPDHRLVNEWEGAADAGIYSTDEMAFLVEDMDGYTENTVDPQ